MKKIVIIIIAAVIIIGSGTFIYFQINKEDTKGDTTNNNGDIIKSDGTIIKPDGTIIKPDGTIIKTDKTIIKADGTIIKPDGTIIHPDGTTTENKNGKADENGVVTYPDGTVVKPDGTIVHPDGTILNPDGTVTHPDGTITDPKPDPTIPTTPEVVIQSGSLCKSNDNVKLSDILTYCINNNGTLNVKSKVEVMMNSDGVEITAAPSVLTDAGANIAFSEKIKNIKFFYYGDEVGMLGRSILTTESGKAYLINNDALYEKAEISVHLLVDISEQIVSFESPSKAAKETTIKTSSGKVYALFDNGSYEER